MPENGIWRWQSSRFYLKALSFSDEDIFVTQQPLAEVYDTTQQNISQHIDGIYKGGRLTPEATDKNFLLVRSEGGWQVRSQKPKRNLKSTDSRKCGSSEAILIVL